MLNRVGFNSVRITGRLEEALKYSHTAYETKFYEGRLEVSDNSSSILIVLPENLINKNMGLNKIEVEGQLRTYLRNDEFPKVLVYMLVKNLRILEDTAPDVNEVIISGKLYGETFMTNCDCGTATDIFIDVDNRYKKIISVPCRAWNKNAFLLKDYKKGVRIKLHGRITTKYFIRENEIYKMIVVGISKVV